MIKGKFVATIEIYIDVDENTPNLLPFEKLKDAVQNDRRQPLRTCCVRSSEILQL